MSDVEIDKFKDFLTVDEAARLVGLSHWTIRMYLHKRRLTKYRLGSRTVVSRQELLGLVHVEKIVPAEISSPAQGAALPSIHTAPNPSEDTKQ